MVSLYGENKIELSPPYQRNDIWTLKQQRQLIDTIEKDMPFPNFFLYLKNGKYEMVDGQQRSRAIIGFAKNQISDFKEHTLSTLTAEEKKRFKKYKILVAIITDISHNETMENYYALVNSTGFRLNRPELMKAEHFKSSFLKLMQSLAENKDWMELDIFAERSKDRMSDIDFIGELLALITFGPSDKKEKVDYLLKAKLKPERIESLKRKFLAVISIIKELDGETTIKNTRFRQKNDFYTLFQFLLLRLTVDLTVFKSYYKLLLFLAPHISPSREDCEPLLDYALNCVTQSNSKHAREKRYDFFVNLLLNPGVKPNDTQTKILEYLSPTTKELVKIGDYYTLDLEKLPHEEP